MEARRRFGEILEGVYYRGDEVIVERAGKVMAAIVPASQAGQRAEARTRLFELIEKNWEHNKDVPYEIIDKEINEAVREVRKKAARSRPSRRR